MQWFRSNVRHGARLALFAMLVQFALTFGHSHWFAQAAALTQFSLHQGGSSTVGGPIDHVVVQKQSPGGSDREQPGEDSCAICAVVAMADTIVSATPPQLLLPLQTVRLLHRTSDTGSIRPKPASAAFQPRAPPIS